MTYEEKSLKAYERYTRLQRHHKMNYNESKLTRISNDTKRRLGLFRVRYDQRSDEAVIATLLDMFEEESGEKLQ